MPLHLKNVTWIDSETFQISNGNLEVSTGPDGAVKFVDACPSDAIDCSNKLVTHAFACGHHHAYSALATGMPAPTKQPQNFREILRYIWWNLDKKLDAEMIRASALVTAMNCAKNGVTFVIDHHASPFAVEDSLEIIAEAFEQVGIGHLLCYEISDRDGAIFSEAGLRESENFLRKHPALVGLHASFTIRDETLKKAVHLAEKYNSGIHIHAAEDEIDQKLCLEEHGCRVVERLSQHGVLQFPKTILAHAIHIDKNECDLLAKSPAWIAVNTESNLNNEVGLFSGEHLDPERIMLGTDGMHSDMIRSAQYHYFAHKKHEQITVNDSYKRLRQVHKYLASNQFAGDTANNLVIFDYNPATPVGSTNFPGHLFYGMTSANISGVISSGNWIVRDRKLVSVDENEIINLAREQARRLWELL